MITNDKFLHPCGSGHRYESNTFVGARFGEAGQPQQHTHNHVVAQNHRTYMGSSTVITRDGGKLIEVGKKRDPFQLYNILNDNEEREELSAQYPENVEQLAAILKREIGSERLELEIYE